MSTDSRKELDAGRIRVTFKGLVIKIPMTLVILLLAAAGYR